MAEPNRDDATTTSSGAAIVKFAAACSRELDSLEAACVVIEQVQQQLGGAAPDLAFVFITPQHARHMEETMGAIAHGIEARHLIGCSAESVIAGSEEHERCSAISVWAAVLPGATIHSGHVRHEETLDGSALIGLPPVESEHSTAIVIGEPFSFPIDQMLARLAEDHPSLQVVGGMASGARSPGENRLYLGDRKLIHGALAVTISGAVEVRPVVSQGCRPIGRPLVVTKAADNRVIELGGERALEKLVKLLDQLTEEDRELARYGLHLGIAIDARRSEQRRGDFLIRGVHGIDADSGAVVVGERLRPGQTVQFQLRDAIGASEDLTALLGAARDDVPGAAGALVFTCNGRGKRLFEEPHHDAGAIAAAFDGIAVGGMFAAGEIGPVGGANFLHGFTASVALFAPGRTS